MSLDVSAEYGHQVASVQGPPRKPPMDSAALGESGGDDVGRAALNMVKGIMGVDELDSRWTALLPSARSLADADMRAAGAKYAGMYDLLVVEQTVFWLLQRGCGLTGLTPEQIRGQFDRFARHRQKDQFGDWLS